MIFLLEFERAQMEPFLLVLGAVLCFLDSKAGDLSDVDYEAQMLLRGQAVAHVPKGCRGDLEDSLRVGTLGCNINSCGLGDKRGCRQTQHVRTPK